MKKRALITAATTAIACGLMAAAFCPGTALAHYGEGTLDLTLNAVKNATTMTVGTEYAASVTDVSTGVQTDQIRVFKFTPAATDDYSFFVTQDNDMYYALYDSTGALMNNVDSTNDASPVNLTKGSTYYLVVSEWYLNYTWSETVSVKKMKAAKSAKVTMQSPASSHAACVYKTVFTYTDGTSSTCWDTFSFASYNGLMPSSSGKVIGNSISDDYGNAVYFKECANDADGKKAAALEAGTIGTYTVNCFVYSYKNLSEAVATTTANFKIVSDATIAASAKATAVKSTMTMGTYKITARSAGMLYLKGNAAAYTYNTAKKILTLVAMGYSYGSSYFNPCAVNMKKGEIVYVQVFGNIYSTGNSSATPSLKAAFYVQNNAATLVSQTIKVKKAKATYKASKLASAAKKFSIGAKAKTKVTYKVTKGAKWVKVSKTGKVTVKKGATKGVYKIRVTAKKSANYAAATKVITIKVK